MSASSVEVNVIDQFAGAGGTSTGVALACRDLSLTPRLTALNHWPLAIETHRLNHPWARHICQDIRKVDPVDASGGRPVSLLATSPECTFHSNARGGKPVNDQQRQSAFVALAWIRKLRPVAVLMENVPEFVNFGPLLPDDRPDPRRKGWTFRQLVGGIRAQGYEVAWRRDICAADYGDATTRTRFFLIARRDGAPLRFPEPTHAEEATGRLARWRAAIDVIDRTLPGRSLFAPGSRPLARATWIRIVYGLFRYGCEEVDGLVDQLAAQLEFTDEMKRRALKGRAEDRRRSRPAAFSLSMASGGVARDAGKPLPTAVGKGGGHLIEPEPLVMTLDRPLTNRCRARPITKPLFTAVGAHERQALFRPFVYSMEHGGRVFDAERPMNTLTTARGGAHAIVQPSFTVGVCGRNLSPGSLDDPLPTAVGSRSTRWVVAAEPYAVPNFGERDGQAPRTLPLATEPMWSATSHGAGGMVESFLVEYNGSGRAGGTRQAHRPLPTATTKDRLALVMPVLDGVGLDILYRMIQNHETAAAMSFPADYKFAGNRGEVTKQIGNAVAVRTARALSRELMRLPHGKSLEDFAA